MAEKGNIWEVLGRSVKWEDVVRHGPKIVEAARVLYETSRQRQQQSAGPGRTSSGSDTSGNRVADLELEVRRLQENEIQQAALVADIASQLESLTASVDALASRVQLLLWLGGGALAVGLLALVLSFIR